MGIVKLPSISELWKRNEIFHYEPIVYRITRDRFFKFQREEKATARLQRRCQRDQERRSAQTEVRQARLDRRCVRRTASYRPPGHQRTQRKSLGCTCYQQPHLRRILHASFLRIHHHYITYCWPSWMSYCNVPAEQHKGIRHFNTEGKKFLLGHMVHTADSLPLPWTTPPESSSI